MSQEEVVAAMGSPLRVTRNRSGNAVLWFGEVNAIMEGDHLAEIGIGPQAPVSLHGVHPFEDSDALTQLCRLDGAPREALGSIVLRRIGVTMGGFHDKDESQRAITVFSRGRWDVLESQMDPFSCK
jgi:hypothetical protein